MRIILSIISFSIITSCNHYSRAGTIQLPPEKSSFKVIKLVDSLGNISFEIPVRYDTAFVWTHYSDCGKSCDKIKYRLQPKSLKITQESGFYWKDEPKSTTIKSNIIDFRYELLTKRNDSLTNNFINNSKYYLKTIRISNGL